MVSGIEPFSAFFFRVQGHCQKKQNILILSNSISIYIYTYLRWALWWSNMAIENPPFIVDVPFKTPIDFGDFPDFPS
jgi:hypothetical protein